MSIQKQSELKCHSGTSEDLPDFLSPSGIEILKKIGLTPREKRAIFFSLKKKIFNLKWKKAIVSEDAELI